MAAASLSQSKALAGCRAMTMVQRTPTVKQVSNGSKYFMRRKGSFMVEVHVSDQETEDQAVKRYMRAVVQSGVLNKLRSRRTKETKIETKQRRMLERIQARKLGVEEPTWEELYGSGAAGDESNPFDEWFCKPGDDDEALNEGVDVSQLPMIDDLYGYGNAELTDVSNRTVDMGGYINPGAAGMVQQQQMGGGYAATTYQQ